MQVWTEKPDGSYLKKRISGKLDNQPEVGKALEQFILRFEREPKNDPELSRFHKFDSKGKVTGVRDIGDCGLYRGECELLCKGRDSLLL